ncbi:DUF550 domain-containing protein [Salmonella enterica]|uniref:DUF550 domain-containing protein n=1 Tax=Salmonella enterica TaxID=28901 RepID=UPI003A0FFB96
MTTITKEEIKAFIEQIESDLANGWEAQIFELKLARIALASLEREQVRREHAEFSDKTFGDVGPVGPLKHLSKEALEAAAEPDDLSEWADMQFLLWDAQRRAGITDEQITQAMVDKLKVNKQREWPEPKDGEPRLHIKEQPAPVVPPAIEPDYEVIKSILPTANPDEYACTIADDMWNACRAAMLQGSQPVSNHDELPYAQVKAVADLYALCWQSGEVVTYTPDPEKATIWINNYSGTCVQEYVKLERLQEALAGNSPVILDGYALVPVEPTPEMREAFHVANEEYESGSYDVWKPDHQWQAMLAAAPQLKIALASIERCQAGFDAKHALFEVAIARFSKMNEGFPIKRFKADWVISWMLENFPPVAQKQGDN